jgi:hypothetical protein
VFAFSCGFTPNAASYFASGMQKGGTFVYSDGGDDTGSAIGVNVSFAGWAAGLIGNGESPSQAAEVIQNVSDGFEAQGIVYQNGDNIIPCQSNGTCAEKRHKLAPK